MIFLMGYFSPPPYIKIRLNEIVPSLHQVLVQPRKVLVDLTEITHSPSSSRRSIRGKEPKVTPTVYYMWS